ncbi:MAG: dTMP kinase [Neisseriaceae bacterium]
MNSNGQFITIEGIDGAGKSTQIVCIQEWCKEKKIELVTTREPGGTKTGEKIRTWLLDACGDISLETEILLMFAARQQHLQEVILPAIQAGKWVVSDRFTDATYAYQGGGRGGSRFKIRQLERWVQGSFKPHLSLFFDLPVEVALQRLSSTPKDRIESEGYTFFQRVREEYLELAKNNADRCHVISSDQPLECIKREVMYSLDLLLKKLDRI